MYSHQHQARQLHEQEGAYYASEQTLPPQEAQQHQQLQNAGRVVPSLQQQAISPASTTTTAANTPNVEGRAINSNRYIKGRLPEGVDFATFPGRSSTPLPTAESKSAERINQLKIWNEAATNGDKRRLNVNKAKTISLMNNGSALGNARRTDSYKDAKDRHSASFQPTGLEPQEQHMSTQHRTQGHDAHRPVDSGDHAIAQHLVVEDENGQVVVQAGHDVTNFNNNNYSPNHHSQQHQHQHQQAQQDHQHQQHHNYSTPHQHQHQHQHLASSSSSVSSHPHLTNSSSPNSKMSPANKMVSAHAPPVVARHRAQSSKDMYADPEESDEDDGDGDGGGMHDGVGGHYDGSHGKFMPDNDPGMRHSFNLPNYHVHPSGGAADAMDMNMNMNMYRPSNAASDIVPMHSHAHAHAMMGGHLAHGQRPTAAGPPGVNVKVMVNAAQQEGEGRAAHEMSEDPMMTGQMQGQGQAQHAAAAVAGNVNSNSGQRQRPGLGSPPAPPPHPPKQAKACCVIM